MVEIIRPRDSHKAGSLPAYPKEEFVRSAAMPGLSFHPLEQNLQYLEMSELWKSIIHHQRGDSAELILCYRVDMSIWTEANEGEMVYKFPQQWYDFCTQQ